MPLCRDVDDRDAEMQELTTKSITDVSTYSCRTVWRRHDYDEVGAIDAQFVTLPEDRLARVKAEPQGESGGEAVGRVEVLEAERKRRERKNRVDGVPAVVDPRAQLRTVPRLFESATPTSRYRGFRTCDAGCRAATAEEGTVALSRENINSIEVDLGDF
ncbi:hypothetical protein FB451DRAFT_1575982 [Mycena latifolia]|nr:hypothetical protein FB451DRAFT_1575982 [Mycena latifolia]